MGKRILVVDDEKLVLNLLRVKLSKCGYDVITTSAAKEFSKLAFAQKPDLLIIDIWLGGGSIGTFVYDQMVEAGFDHNVPVIFMSALVDQHTSPRQFTEKGKCVLYGKPFNFDLLLEDVRLLVDVNEQHLKEAV